MEKYNEDDIELKLPVNPAYVSAARLTASSIANRMGFNIEDIEDIKAAVSEACTYLIKRHYLSTQADVYKIVFSLLPEKLIIHLCIQTQTSDEQLLDETELGILMIQSLMDQLEYNIGEDNQLHIIMHKNLG